MSNSSGVVPARDRANASSRVATASGSCVAKPSKNSWSRSTSALYGCRAASEGPAFTSPSQVRNRKSNCGGIGCSTHSVPSLSNVAIRSPGSTNAAPGVVALWT
ncbi:hypothetical protein [Streptomyces goshikiensis]|uniref:hypothetical protein n=1 Tax=Streptomyces goshikiensis TaxID=1942 RepID=UPI0036686F66